MTNQMDDGFHELAEPVLAQTTDGRSVSLEPGHSVRLLSGHWDAYGQLVWRFEDRDGNEYRVRERMPRMVAT